MPDWAARVRARLDGLPLDPATEVETIEEIAQHVEDRYRDLLARGVSESDAAAQALRELEGHPRLAREIASARRRLMPEPTQDTSRVGFAAIADDLRFAWRRLHRTPGFTLVAVVTLALTIGANTAILSVADAVLFRPLPYADADNVAIIQMLDRKRGSRYTQTPHAFLDAMNECCPSVSEVALTGLGPRVTVESPDGPTTVATLAVTPNYFGILGVTPARGRMLHEGDMSNASRAAVLSFSTWQQHFGGDESIVGRSVTLGTSTFDIVGILPPGFLFPSLFVGRPPIVVLRPPLAPGTAGGTFHAIARIAPGVSRERAQAEVAAASAPVSSGLTGRADSVPVLDDVRRVLYPVGRPVMRYLLAATGLILLLGCANLANMMLVRGRRRIHETAVRLALGATRMRLIRPAMFEALIIGLAGAALAVLATALTFEALLKLVPPAAYGRAPVGVDERVIAMSLGLGIIASVLFGIVPAWRSAGVPVLTLLRRRGGRIGRRSRLGRPLIGVQVAVALAVVFGAAVAGRAFVSLVQMPLGFSTDKVLQITTLPPKGIADRQQYYERIIDEARRHPHVLSAGAGGSLPFSSQGADEGTEVGGVRSPAGIVYALPGYFETASIPVVRGRSLTWDDARQDPDVAVVSVSAARVMFPNAEPLGAVFTNGRGRQFRVIGVVGDVVNSFNGEELLPAYVLPGANTRVLSVLARMRDDSASAVADLRARLRPIAGSVTPTTAWWADQLSSHAYYRDRKFQTLVLGSLAALALGLTALGIFSVVAYLVAARTREMGVRLAIGASPGSLIGLIARQSLIPVAIGLVGGLVLVLWGGRLAEAQFFTVEAHDPVMLAVAAATVVVAALLAAYFPARRATRINPTDVLRAE